MQTVILDAKTLGRADLSAIDNVTESVTYYQTTAAHDTLAHGREASIIVTNKVVINRDIIRQCPHLKLIVVAATGTNNVDLGAAQEQGITVCNVPDYAGPAVAQYVFAQLLMLKHQTQAYRNAMQQGLWSKSDVFSCLDFPIEELAGHTLGVIGYGTLGQSVSQMARAFGMQVLVAERKYSDVCRAGRTPFIDVIQQADVVSLHCPLTANTEKLIDSEVLAQMKPSAVLINTARGPVVDEYALAEAIQHKYIGGAIIDVLGQEPPDANHPLLQAQGPNLIVTPHIAWATEAAIQRLVKVVADNIHHFLCGQPQNQVTS